MRSRATVAIEPVRTRAPLYSRFSRDSRARRPQRLTRTARLYGRKLTPMENVGYPTRIVSVTVSLKW